MKLIAFDCDLLIKIDETLERFCLLQAIKDIYPKMPMNVNWPLNKLSHQQSLELLIGTYLNCAPSFDESLRMQKRFEFHLASQFVIKPNDVTINLPLLKDIESQMASSEVLLITRHWSFSVILMHHYQFKQIRRLNVIGANDESDFNYVLSTVDSRYNRIYGKSFFDERRLISDNNLLTEQALFNGWFVNDNTNHCFVAA